MRAVVLGGGGLTGRGAVRQLSAGRVFDEVVAADVDPALADAAAKAGGRRATASPLDVRDRRATADLLQGAAVVVNATPYAFNLEAMAAALAARVPYLDFGGLFHMTRRQLELDATFRAAHLLAIPGLGQVPGVSNVLAVAAAEPLERVDSVVLRDGWRDLASGGPEISFTWSPATFLDEMVRPAVVFENGSYHEHPPMSGAEEYDFAPPVGRTVVYRTLHSEPATLPESLRSKGLRHCEWKEGGPGIELLRALGQLGLGSETPLEVHGAKVVPREFTLALLRRENLMGPRPGAVVDDWEVLDIELRGSEGGRPTVRHARARFPPWPDWHLAATEYAVGTAGAIGAEMIARGEIRGEGVVPPERCVPAASFRQALERRGIRTAVVPPEPDLPAPKAKNA
jgi:lysine 6-dehydrogenase